MTFEEETLQEIYNLCSHHKNRQGSTGILANMICDKIESTRKYETKYVYGLHAIKK